MYFKFGWTLLELMVVLTIISVLTGVGYLTYQKHLESARRLEGKAALLEFVTKLERDPTHYPKNKPSRNGYYELELAQDTPDYYRVRAKALGAQNIQDTHCSVLEIDSLGNRTPNDCW